MYETRVCSERGSKLKSQCHTPERIENAQNEKFAFVSRPNGKKAVFPLRKKGRGYQKNFTSEILGMK